MPQVTKRIQATSTLSSQSKSYAISPSGTISTTQYYNPLNLTFDTSSIKNCTSAKLVYKFSKAQFNKQYDMTGTVKCYTSIDSSIYSNDWGTFGTGSYEVNIDSSKLDRINTIDSITVDIDGIVKGYSGTKPDYTKQLGYLYETLDLENCYLEVSVNEPSVSSFVVTGGSADSVVIGTWVQEDVESWVVNAKLNGQIKVTTTGTTSGFSLPVGTFTEEGVYEFILSAYCGSTSVTATTNLQILLTHPVITTLEPNGVNQLNISNIQISFSGSNFTKYDIKAKQNGIIKWSNSASVSTTSFSFNMVKNLFDLGYVDLELTLTYDNGYYQTIAIQTARFLVYGVPSIPVITSQAIYSTPVPTINFRCSDLYISYQLELDGIVQTETYGSPNKYTYTSPLTNEAYHTFKVRVKNSYNLWSSWASVTFKVSYAELEEPMINVYADTSNGTIVINVESDDQSNFHNHSIIRSEDGTTWTVIATGISRIGSYKDISCSSGTKYYYKARAVDTFGGIKDSVAEECTCILTKSVLSIPDKDISVTLEYYNNFESAYKKVKNNTSRNYVQVCGLNVPKSQKSEVKYKSIQLSIAFKTKEEYENFMKLEDAEVLLYRDKHGLKMYCDMVISEYEEMQFYYRTVNVTLNEVYYSEGDYAESYDTGLIISYREC